MEENNNEMIISQMISTIENQSFKGILNLDGKYIVTDGYRLLIFKNLNNDIYEKYKVKPNQENQNFKFDFDKILNYSKMKINIEDIEKHNAFNSDIPYTFQYENNTYGVNAKYLLDAIQKTNSEYMYISPNVFEPICVKGGDIDYYIMPINLKKNEMQNFQLDWKKVFITLAVIIGIIVFSVHSYHSSNIRMAKSTMLSALQKHCTQTLTVDDIDIIKTIEKENTYEIYQVQVNKSSFDMSGNIYVAFSKPNGTYTSTVLLSSDLSKLRETLNNL